MRRAKRLGSVTPPFSARMQQPNKPARAAFCLLSSPPAPRVEVLRAPWWILVWRPLRRASASEAWSLCSSSLSPPPSREREMPPARKASIFSPRVTPRYEARDGRVVASGNSHQAPALNPPWMACEVLVLRAIVPRPVVGRLAGPRRPGALLKRVRASADVFPFSRTQADGVCVVQASTSTPSMIRGLVLLTLGMSAMALERPREYYERLFQAWQKVRC
jgi:hypothetical protein